MHIVIALLIALALGIAGCAETGKVSTSGELLSLGPVETETFAIDYQRLAECAYLKLQEPGIQKADFPTQHMTKVNLDAGRVRQWEVAFVAEGPKRTRVEIAAVTSIWGPVGYRKLMPTVRACAGA
jgi:hypothetical protein